MIYIFTTFLFYFLIFFVGIWVSKDGDVNSESIFLANRKLPLGIGIFTMTATWVGGGYINGSAEAVFSSGLLWTQAPYCYAISLILGGLFFAGPMHRIQAKTMLDPFERRLGVKTTCLFFLPALCGELFWSAAILAALGMTFATVFGISFEIAVISSASIAIIYTMAGGMRAVAYTDVVQLLLVVLGLGLACWSMSSHVENFDTLWASYKNQLGTSANFLPAFDSPIFYSWWDSFLLLALGGIPWGVYFQRVLSCSDAKSARRLSIYAGVGCILMVIPPAYIGMVATQADWMTLIGKQPDPAMILPLSVFHLTPPLISALGIGAILAAVMSSVDSSILSIANMFNVNILRHLAPQLFKDSRGIHSIKLTILLAGAAATGLALSVKSVYALWYLSADLVFVILFPQLFSALFTKSYNSTGAILGFLSSLILRSLCGESMLSIDPIIFVSEIKSGSLPFRTGIMLFSLFVIQSGSFLHFRLGKTEAFPPKKIAI